jgi:hypothetical protein
MLCKVSVDVHHLGIGMSMFNGRSMGGDHSYDGQRKQLRMCEVSRDSALDSGERKGSGGKRGLFITNDADTSPPRYGRYQVQLSGPAFSWRSYARSRLSRAASKAAHSAGQKVANVSKRRGTRPIATRAPLSTPGHPVEDGALSTRPSEPPGNDESFPRVRGSREAVEQLFHCPP